MKVSSALGAPDAIAVAGTGVWVANSRYQDGGRGWLTEISARTGALIRVVAAQRYKLTDPEALAVDGSSLWVADGNGDAVTEINATTGDLIRVISGPRYQLNDPAAIAADVSSVWVASGGGDSLTQISARTGALVRVITAARYRLDTTLYPPSVTVAANRVWVPDQNNDAVTEVNATTGALIRVIPSLPNAPFAITADRYGAWVVTNLGEKAVDGSRPDGSIAELSATSGQLIRDVYALPFRADNPGGAITADGGHVWVTDTGFYTHRGWVAELKAATGALIRVVAR